MPANLKDLRNRIKSVKNNQKITKAMQLVSAAKFGRAQSAVINARPYASELAKLVKSLAYFVRGGSALPLLSANESKNALIVVVSSERGLCGGYNANVAKQANKTWDTLKSEGYQVALTCIGKKAFQSLLRKKPAEHKSGTETTHIGEEKYITQPDTLLDVNGLSLITTPFEKQLDQSVEPLAEALSTLYAQQKIGKLVVVYSRFQSAMVQTSISSTILPLSFEREHNHAMDPAVKPRDDKVSLRGSTAEPSTAEPIFEPERDELLSMALPRYMSSQIFHMLLEARASEYGARMTAMDNATRNAKEIEKKLQITYQRARQAAITNELIEIISGAEAL